MKIFWCLYAYDHIYDWTEVVRNLMISPSQYGPQ